MANVSLNPINCTSILMTLCLIRMLATSSIPEVHQGEWHQRLLGGDLPKSNTMSDFKTWEGGMTKYGFVLLASSWKVLSRKLNFWPDIIVVSTMWSRYDSVSFLKNTHRRQLIAQPVGRDMRCLVNLNHDNLNEQCILLLYYRCHTVYDHTAMRTECQSLIFCFRNLSLILTRPKLSHLSRLCTCRCSSTKCC